MLLEFHCHCVCHTHTSHHSVIFASRKSSNIFYLILFILQVYYTCSVEHICFWKHFCLNFVSESRITQCIFWVLGSVWAFLNLSLSISISLLWSSTVQYSKVTGNLYSSPLIKLSWCYDLLLLRVLQTCLSCLPFHSPNPITCTSAKWRCKEVPLDVHIKIIFMIGEVDDFF
jgi:hypothetical protein